MRISATQRKSGDWRSAATERLGDVLHSEGEVLRSSDARWLGIEMSRLDAPGKAMALTDQGTRSKGNAKIRVVAQRQLSAGQWLRFARRGGAKEWQSRVRSVMLGIAKELQGRAVHCLAKEWQSKESPRTETQGRCAG